MPSYEDWKRMGGHIAGAIGTFVTGVTSAAKGKGKGGTKSGQVSGQTQGHGKPSPPK